MSNRRQVRRWHHWLGLSVTVFVILLSITGLMLNHAGLLRLHEVEVEAEWILGWYGISGIPEDAVSVQIGDQWISSANGWTYLDSEPISTGGEVAVGAVKTENLILVASAREMQLFTHDGDLIERFFPAGFEADIAAIGIANGLPLVRAGDARFQSDRDALSWTQGGQAGEWSTTQPIPGHLIPKLNGHLRGDGLPLYRILLDVHSGRFFTNAGPLVMDGAALILLTLNITGLWLWWRRR